ncbi:MAG: proton-conducting transporter membrane subunit [Victivallales bacterium]
MLILIILTVPLLFSGIILLRPSLVLQKILLTAYAVLHLSCSAGLYFSPGRLSAYFQTDELNILFLLLLSAVFLAVSVYHLGSDEIGNDTQGKLYTVFLLLFVDSMNGAILSAHLGLLWVFVEASTLSSAMLVYHHGNKTALEAAWKYIFICSIGISFAFIGIIFLSVGSVGIDSLFFRDLNRNAANINPFWLKLALPFLLVGFGTKMGLSPMHNWLPDAHSEAPSPVSAMLSATLLNAALLGILRVHKITFPAGLEKFSESILLAMGLISIFISAVFIVNARNYKRMLAYSSIEHMGIIAIGLGLGGAGIFAALLHMVGHSLAKSAFFLTAGNIYSLTHSKKIKAVRGLFWQDNFTAWLWVFSFLAICAFPPFSTFISELMIIKEMLAGHIFLLVFFMGCLTLVIYGMSRQVMKMVSGVPGIERENKFRPGLWSYIPQTVLLAAALAIGIGIPAWALELIKNAAGFIR